MAVLAVSWKPEACSLIGKKETLACILSKAEIPANLILVGHDHVQHVGSIWKIRHALPYQTYLILKWNGLDSSMLLH